jgi:uncharacterized SAM-binding protein YcdF (DUF218 family)
MDNIKTRLWFNMHRRKIIIGMILFSLLAGLFYLLKNPTMQAVANYLTIEENYAPADVIIVLGGEIQGERSERAVELYKAGLASQFLLSDGTWMSWRIRSIDEMQDYLLAKGIPSEVIHLESQSRSTYENALYCLEVMKQQGWRSAVVVTTFWHSRRSQFVFEKVYANSNIKLSYAVASDKNIRNLQRWWKDPEKMQVVMTEWSKLIVYGFRY